MSGLRRTLKRLWRAPSFSLPAALTLCLGIGGTAAVFTVVNGVLLRPLPYPHSEKLVDLTHTLVISGAARIDQSDATYLLYHDENRAFTDIGIYRDAQLNLGGSRSSGGAPAERVTGAMVSASVFAVLRSAPLRGRGLVDDDNGPGALPVVVIGQGLWQRFFGGDASVVGRRILVDGVEREIVGVMRSSFHFPNAETALWLPLTLDRARTRSAAFDFHGIARLRDGATIASAAANLQQLLPRVPEVFPGRLTLAGITSIHMQADVRPLRDVIIGDIGRVLWIVLGAVSVLLLVACANVANLFLARAEGRQRELAVRRALGAGRWSIVLDHLNEALVLGVIGGVLGLAAAEGSVTLLQNGGFGAGIPRLADVRIDGTVMLVTAGVATLAALISAALPLARLKGGNLAGVLGSYSASTSGGRARSRIRRGLVVAQVSLALMLVACAGLLARSYERLRQVDPGFIAEDALTFRVALPAGAYPSSVEAARLILRGVDSLLALPGVQAAAITSKLPLDPVGRQDTALFIEDRPLAMSAVVNLHPVVFVSAGYFRAMGIPLHAGREFTAADPGADPATLPKEVIVSEALAQRYWNGESALGRHVRFNPAGPWLTVVGVVGNVRDAGLAQPPDQLVYSPLVTQSVTGMAYMPRDLAVVTRAPNVDRLADGVARTMAALDATLPIYRLGPAEALLSSAVARTTVTALLLGVAALVALAIGAAGIYGVAAYLVTLRTREIGVRMALGAGPREVRRLVLGHVVLDAGIGVTLGLAGAVLISRVMQAVVYDISPLDPPVLAAAALVLLTVALAAGIVPARRAVKLDPMTAFRVE